MKNLFVKLNENYAGSRYYLHIIKEMDIPLLVKVDNYGLYSPSYFDDKNCHIVDSVPYNYNELYKKYKIKFSIMERKLLMSNSILNEENIFYGNIYSDKIHLSKYRKTEHYHKNYISDYCYNEIVSNDSFDEYTIQRRLILDSIHINNSYIRAYYLTQEQLNKEEFMKLVLRNYPLEYCLKLYNKCKKYKYNMNEYLIEAIKFRILDILNNPSYYYNNIVHAHYYSIDLFMSVTKELNIDLSHLNLQLQ